MDSIDYPAIMDRAVQGAIADILMQVVRHGLPGDHHFVICFSTEHPDARVPEWIKEQYPEAMVIVLQHWFDNLAVSKDGFSVTLNFSDTPEDLHVPFASILSFMDPSVGFKLYLGGLPQEDEDAPDASPAEQQPKPPTPAKAASPGDGEPDKIVSLDRFRKGAPGKKPA